MGTLNVERGTLNVRMRAQAREGGDTGARMRPHSFIRFPFVDSGDGTGAGNVGTWERGNVERGNVGTLNVERGNVER